MLRTAPPPPALDTDDAASLTATGLARAHRRGRLVRLGVWAAIAAGPLALAASCATSPVPRTAAHSAQAVPSTAASTDPGGFAQMFLSLWLRSDSAADGAQSAVLRSVAPGVDLLSGAQSAQGAQAAQSARAVAQTVVISSAQIQPGYWSVVVAAEITTGGSTQLRYFAVPVQVSASGAGAGALGAMTVVAAPAEVAPPANTGGVETAYSVEALSSSALAQSASAFLQAYLTGAGEIASLLAPGARVTALSAPPYAQLQVSAVGVDRTGLDGPVPADGITAEVWVQATATDPAGTRWPLHYALRMRARAGRWEVAALEPGPLLAAAQSSASAAAHSGSSVSASPSP
jgi:hypothetical protein